MVMDSYKKKGPVTGKSDGTLSFNCQFNYKIYFLEKRQCENKGKLNDSV